MHQIYCVIRRTPAWQSYSDNDKFKRLELQFVNAYQRISTAKTDFKVANGVTVHSHLLSINFHLFLGPSRDPVIQTNGWQKMVLEEEKTVDIFISSACSPKL